MEAIGSTVGGLQREPAEAAPQGVIQIPGSGGTGITAPGAPLSGLAVPASTPPKPSPIHHTPSDHATERPSAALTLGRQAIPMAMRSWMQANAPFASVG